MKFVCPQNQLTGAIALASRAVAARPDRPALAGVLLVADLEAQTLALTGFNLEVGIHLTVAAAVKESGELVLPAKLFGDIVSRLPESDVTVTVREVTAVLACGSSRYEIQGLPAAEFEDLPVVDAQETLYLPVEKLLEGLRASLFAAATDETKQVLRGVRVTASAERLELAATDGHRLAVVEMALVEPGAEAPVAMANLEATIPVRTLRELERMLMPLPEVAVAVQCDRAQVTFASGDRRLTSRLLDGAYPNYRQLLPAQFEREVTLERKQLVAALERVAILADRKNNIVKLTIDAIAQEVKLSVEAPDLANGSETLTVQASGESIDIAFNVRYLLDGLKVMDAAEVQLRLNGAVQPAVLQPLGSTKMSYLIMPVQIRS
ncbi:MAG: DNA polymerase III subunit beta [Oscillatoriales cyanobacterium SM2_1_8]|nr:DNA polymerase III subunit beta [Oscillatoriales cyanobacterium SM2_1_8]